MEKLCDKVDNLSCEEEEDREDLIREDDIIIKCKWAIDGSSTLDEAIKMLHAYIEYLKELKANGYELTGPVEDDYGFLRKTPLVSAEKKADPQ
jgi:hypothetical protein